MSRFAEKWLEDRREILAVLAIDVPETSNRKRWCWKKGREPGPGFLTFLAAERVQYPGEMGYVPWVRLYLFDETIVEFPLRALAVRYGPIPEPGTTVTTGDLELPL